MVTVLKVATRLQPGEVARILNMRRQGAPLTMAIGSEQLMFDLEVKATEIDVPGRKGKLTMSHLLTILQLHRGKARAITGKDLAQLLGEPDDRMIRREIRELIAEGYPIASSTEKPYGYFMADTPEEAAQYLKQLKSRLVEDAYRRRDFKKAAARALSKEKQLALL